MADKPYSGPPYTAKSGASVAERKASSTEQPISQLRTPGDFLREVERLYEQYRPDDPSGRRISPEETDRLYIKLTTLGDAFTEKVPEEIKEGEQGEEFWRLYGALEHLCTEEFCAEARRER